jgi:serine/threonine protein kinase
VHEVSSFNLSGSTSTLETLDLDEDNEVQEDQQNTSGISDDYYTMKTECLRGTITEGQFAIKRIKRSRFETKNSLLNGIVDLATEAKFLSVLDHPNIISLRGVADCSPYELNYFVIIDRLTEILSNRLITWKQQEKSRRSLWKKVSSRKSTEGHKHLAFLERCTVAFDVACALAYMHSMK